MPLKVLDITAKFLRETPKAVLVEQDGNEVWLPKSQIEWDEEASPGERIDLIVPEWLAEDKGIS